MTIISDVDFYLTQVLGGNFSESCSSASTVVHVLNQVEKMKHARAIFDIDLGILETHVYSITVNENYSLFYVNISPVFELIRCNLDEIMTRHVFYMEGSLFFGKLVSANCLKSEIRDCCKMLINVIY